MKKSVLLTLILVISISSLSAVDIVIGAKAALSDYSYRGRDWQDQKETFDLKDMFSLSYSGGAWFNAQFSPFLGIQIESLLVSSRIRYDRPSGWVQQQFTGISLPVYYRGEYRFDKFGLYFLAGPRFHFLFDSTKVKEENGNVTSGDLKDLNVDNSFAIGAGVGTGITLDAGPGVLDIGFLYSTNLSRVSDDTAIYPYALELEVGYGFRL